MKKRKDMIFESSEALKPVINVINEAADALEDKTRLINKSPIHEVLAGALGAGIGATGSFAALYGLGTVGLSAAGITSGLAVAGGVIGGGMVAGVFVLAAPIVIVSGFGISIANKKRHKQLKQEKEKVYKNALKKHEGILNALKVERDSNKERLDYLQSIDILLTNAIKDLKKDLEDDE